MIEVAKRNLFKNPITMRFTDQSLQELYSRDEYNSQFTIFYSLLLFAGSSGLLSFTIVNLMNKVLDFNLFQLLIIVIPVFILLIISLLTMYFKSKSRVVNMSASIVLNLSLFCIAEHFKYLLSKYWITKLPIFYCDFVHIALRGGLLILVDSTFLNHLFCYLLYVPLYFSVFTTHYTNPENQEVLYMLLLSGLSLGSIGVERGKKEGYYRDLVKKHEKRKILDMMNNVKSGYVVYDIINNKLEYNKSFEKRLFSRMLNHINIENEILQERNLRSLAEQQRLEASAKNKGWFERIILKIKNKFNKNTEDKSEGKQEVKVDIDESSSGLAIQQLSLKLVLNSLFYGSERVNSYDFEGEFKKEIIKLNEDKSDGKSKQGFYRGRTKILKNSENASENGVNLKEDATNSSPLYNEDQLMRLLSVLVRYPDSTIDFKYLATKKLSDTGKQFSNISILVRYDCNTGVIEFLVNDISSVNGPQSEGLINKTSAAFTSNNQSNGMQYKEMKEALESMNYNSRLVSKQVLDLIESESSSNISTVRNLTSLFQLYLNDLSITNSLINNKQERSHWENISIDNFIGNLSDVIETKAIVDKKKVKVKSQIASSVPDKFVFDHKKLQMLILYCVNAGLSNSAQSNVTINVGLKNNRKKAFEIVIADDCCEVKDELIKKINSYNYEELMGEAEFRDISSRWSLNSMMCCFLKIKFLIEGIEAGVTLEKLSPEGIRTTLTLNLISSEEDSVQSNLIPSPSISDYIITESNKETGRLVPIKKNLDKVTHSIKSPNQEKIELSNEPGQYFIIADSNSESRATTIKRVKEHTAKNSMYVSYLEASDGVEVLTQLLYAFENDLFIQAIIFDDNMMFVSGPVLAELLRILKKRAVIPDDIKLFMTTELDYLNSSMTNEVELLSKLLDYVSLSKMTKSLL